MMENPLYVVWKRVRKRIKIQNEETIETNIHPDWMSTQTIKKEYPKNPTHIINKEYANLTHMRWRHACRNRKAKASTTTPQTCQRESLPKDK